MSTRNAWVERSGSRFLGRYRDETGKKKSAGTYDTSDQALAAAERRAGLGEAGDYFDMTLTEYLLHWRDSNLGSEKTSHTMKWAHYKTLNRYVLPTYGKRRIRDFEAQPFLAHQIVTSVLDHPQASRTSQRRVRMALGSAFRPLVKMHLVRFNPMAGVEVKNSPRSKQPIFKTDEFLAIVNAMELEAQKACLKVMLYSAMRPGEIFAMRVSDITFRPNGMAFIDQARKIEMTLDPKQPEALEVPGSKTGDGHLVKLSAKQAQVLADHIQREGLTGDDLVFPRRLVGPDKGRPRMDLTGFEPGADYGWYEDGGRRARHGTATAYSYRCRCFYCKAAMTLLRRESRERRTVKRSKRPACADDYMTSRRWYPIFKEAVARAGIEWDGKAYTTRAAAATWMFKAGASLPDVQEAMNHSNAATTLQYLRAAMADENETVNSTLDDVI